MLRSTSPWEALLACPPFPPWHLPSFTVESTLPSPCSRYDSPLSRQGAALAHLDSLPPHGLILQTDGSVPFPFGKGDSAAAPGFNSLIPAPSVPVPSLISTEPVELFCRASNISSMDPFCFLKQNTGNGRSFLAVFYLQICAAPPSVRRTKIQGDISYHTALITIKQGDQHSGPNRNPKHNQIETKIYYSFLHVDVLTRTAKIHVVTIYIRADAPVIYMSQTCGLI